jgi:hypothetical protein
MLRLKRWRTGVGEASLARVVWLSGVTLRPKRRQAAALQNGLGMDSRREREDQIVGSAESEASGFGVTVQGVALGFNCGGDAFCQVGGDVLRCLLDVFVGDFGFDGIL